MNTSTTRRRSEREKLTNLIARNRPRINEHIIFHDINEHSTNLPLLGALRRQKVPPLCNTLIVHLFSNGDSSEIFSNTHAKMLPIIRCIMPSEKIGPLL